MDTIDRQREKFRERLKSRVLKFLNLTTRHTRKIFYHIGATLKDGISRKKAIQNESAKVEQTQNIPKRT
jgi:hypothetical protein